MSTSPAVAIIVPSPPVAVQATAVSSALVLNGIFFSEGQGYALINNQIVKESDVIDGAKVLKITSDAVELDSSGTKITLTSN